MPRFFVEPSAWKDGIARIAGEDARHIARVLRMTAGEELTLCDGAGMEYDGVIERADAEQVLVRTGAGRASCSEPNVDITLLMAVPKGEKMELIIQKATELGVGTVVPVLTARCVSRPDAKAMEKKRVRWQRVALEAAKQSGRGRVPQVLPEQELKQALSWADQCELSLFFYEKEEGRTLRSVLEETACTSVAILIGPEGGFEELEAQQIEAAGFRTATLGKRILRCETAPLAAISAILYHYHNF